MNPDYILKHNAELVVYNNQLYQVKVELVPFHACSAKTKLAIASALEDDQPGQLGLDILNIDDENDRIEQYAFCKFGGWDNQADIKKDGTLVPEYFDCPRRPTCPKEAQKFLCGVFWINETTFLTPREIQYIKLTADDLPDKQIAERMCISISTVASHRKHIQRKLNVPTKIGITRFALERGIITPA